MCCACCVLHRLSWKAICQAFLLFAPYGADARRSRASSCPLLAWPPAQWAWSERCAQRTLMPPRTNYNQRHILSVATIRWRAHLLWNALCAPSTKLPALTPRFTGEGDALPAGTKVHSTANLDRKYNAKIARVPLVRCKRIVRAISPFTSLPP